MNRLNAFITGIGILLIMIIASCAKENSTTVSRDYLDDITGTYKGTFVSTDTAYDGYASTADISLNGSNQLFIHCYGDPLDTTFILDAFKNGDSVMVCETGIAFYHEYGHMGNGYHMMDMGNNQSEWMHHLDQDHQPGDQHYGGFDLDYHTFDYRIKIMVGSTTEILEFQGTKQ